MHVLLTGASGFLGSHLVEALQREGHEVRALVRPSSDRTHLHQVPCVVGDLVDSASLHPAVEGVQAVIHAAAKVDDAGTLRDFRRVNVDGTTALLAASRQAGVGRFVFISSPSAVMDGRDQVGIDESQPYPQRFLHPYAQTKAEAEQAVLAANSATLQACALRPRGLWGPRDRTGPMPRLLARLAAGRLPDVSGGRQILADMCYVGNAVDACLLALGSPRCGGRAYFVTDGDPIDVWATARELAERLHLDPPTRTLSPRLARGMARGLELLWRAPLTRFRRTAPPLTRYGLALISQTHTYDTSAARSDLGYKPRFSRDEALERYLAWIDAQGGLQAYLRTVEA